MDFCGDVKMGKGVFRFERASKESDVVRKEDFLIGVKKGQNSGLG